MSPTSRFSRAEGRSPTFPASAVIGVAFAVFALAAVASGSVATAAASTPKPGAVHAHAAGCAVPIGPGVSWPAARWADCFPGAIAQSSPTIGTYGDMTILAVGDENGMVHVVDAMTGAELPGWPKQMESPPGAKVAIEGSPTIAYLNGPQHPPSIVVGTASIWAHNVAREVEAFTIHGRVRFIFHVGSAPGTAPGVFSTPAVGSLTGGSQQDIVFGSWDHYIYALNPSGKLLPGFPINNADTIWSSPALYHVAGTTGDSIFVGGDASGWHGCRGGWISDYRLVHGSPALIWQHCENQSIWSSPAVGVINSTRRPAIVVGTGFYEQPFPSATNKLFAFYADNGAPVPGWPVTTPGPTIGSPAIGVVNNTGDPAVVETSWICGGGTAASCTATNASEVTAWNGKGAALWQTRLRGATTFSSPILAPLSSSQSWNDVLVGSPYGLYAINGSDGGYMFGTTAATQHSAINFTCRVYNAAAVASIANVASGLANNYVFEACGGPEEFHHVGEIAAFRLPNTLPAVSSGWPMFHANSSHDGVAS